MGLTRNEELGIYYFTLGWFVVLGTLLDTLFPSRFPTWGATVALGAFVGVALTRRIKEEAEILGRCRRAVAKRMGELTDPYWPGAGE